MISAAIRKNSYRIGLFWFVLTIILVLTGQSCLSNKSVPMEKVTFTTEDGVEIFADYYSIKNPKKFALLLHMMPATKESWQDFARELNRAGYAVLAFDQRGHGESTKDGRLNYQEFEDRAQQAKRLDVEAAFSWLGEQGANEENTALVGASIGANLAIRFLVDHPGISRVVALSPGLDYRGVTTNDAIEKYNEHQKVFLFATEEDGQSAESVRILQRNHPFIQSEVISGQSHGTDIFEDHSDLMKQIIKWLEE